mmetsp:Transcript_92483/g.258516  ORF Transcript_92483/g.258516 Transcript_92483/m.258516 type:complete len:303 (-) Transcript_92483:1088-1996(-)
MARGRQKAIWGTVAVGARLRSQALLRRFGRTGLGRAALCPVARQVAVRTHRRHEQRAHGLRSFDGHRAVVALHGAAFFVVDPVKVRLTTRVSARQVGHVHRRRPDHIASHVGGQQLVLVAAPVPQESVADTCAQGGDDEDRRDGCGDRQFQPAGFLMERRQFDGQPLVAHLQRDVPLVKLHGLRLEPLEPRVDVLRGSIEDLGMHFGAEDGACVGQGALLGHPLLGVSELNLQIAVLLAEEVVVSGLCFKLFFELVLEHLGLCGLRLVSIELGGDGLQLRHQLRVVLQGARFLTPQFMDLVV